MHLAFGDALLIFGGLLTVAAALSGLMRGTVLSVSVLAVTVGVVLAAAGVVTIEPKDNAVIELIEIALVLTLFADGLAAERELLTVHWGPVTRAIVLAMPITLGLLGLAAHTFISGLTWAEAFLLAAVLSPTDPVITSAVVTSRRVPERVRHILNLESGLNDGIAVPFVLFFLILARPGRNPGPETLTLLGEAAYGALVGVVLGVIGGRLHDRLPGGGITRRYEGIYAVGFGLMAFGFSDVTVGNGFIAAFVCGIALGAAEHDIPDAFGEFAENVSTISQVITFFVFGALIYSAGFDGEVWQLALFVLFTLLVARPIAIGVAFVRAKLPASERAFISWFGPKGVASMLFALFVLNSTVLHRHLIFEVAAFTVIASIVAHGLTDTLGTRWLERQAKENA
jgi:NhaP-type Na+/H+ or K+/H+ antiporter